MVIKLIINKFYPKNLVFDGLNKYPFKGKHKIKKTKYIKVT